MSNTRRRTSDGPLAQERYASSREYAELRGIHGGAVAAKAATLENPRKRSLLFFLQAISLRPGGLNQFTKDFLAMFPERIGSPAMHRAGLKSGRIYSRSIAEEIISDLLLWDPIELMGDANDDERFQPASDSENTFLLHPTVDRFLEVCRVRASQDLPGFVTELCINPRLSFRAEGDEDWMIECERESAERIPNADGCAGGRFYTASLPWFDDIIGALFEFKKRFEEAARDQFVMTTIGQEVFETLDFCLATSKPVAIVGTERIGRTTAVEAWCNLHLGEVRFVSLSGLMTRTALLRSIAKALGLASSYTRKAVEMQVHVEDFLQRSRLVLVIDESHFLFSQNLRLYSRPEMIDWLDTALYNHGVPFALCATPQFAHRLNDFEKQTGWNAGQFKGRVKRWRVLELPTPSDLMAVAKKYLPEGDAATITLIVGYALGSKRHMPAIVDVIDEARLLAAKAHRPKVKYEDVDRAITDFVKPSDDAKERAFVPPGRTRTMPLKAGCKAAETPLHGPGRNGSAEGAEDLAGSDSDSDRAGRSTLTRIAPALAG